MSDAQLAAILGSIVTLCGTIAAAIRFGVNRLTKSQDRMVAAHDRSTDALIENTASNSVLVVKIDAIADRLGVTVEKQPKKKRAQTSPGHRIEGLRVVTDDE